MKKSLRKLFLLMAVVVTAMLCLAFSTGALGVTGQCGDNVSWTYNASTGELVISGTGDMYSFNNYPLFECSPFENSDIKSVLIENGVTSVGSSAFYGCGNLKSVTIPNSVTFISGSAFADCENLTSITIPDSVTSISGSAFENTGYYNDESNWVNKVLYIGNYLMEAKNDISGSYEIKNGTTVIAHGAFYSCEDLAEIIIPDSVIVIGNSAFKYCSLTSISIGNGVKIIGDEAFLGIMTERDKVYAKEIFIPESVETIGEHEVGWCWYGGIGGSDWMRRSTLLVVEGSTAEKYAKENYFNYEIHEHDYSNNCDITCDLCGAIRTLNHTYDNGCDKDCNICGETRDISHTYKNVTTKATLTKNGKIENKCSVCGNVKSTTVIYYPKTITLSNTAYTYNGKVQTPTVTVKDSKGNTLKNGTDYKVTYEKGRKNPGKYTVRIDFIGNYSGTKRVYFTIAPSTPAITKTAQSTDAIRLTWNKVTGATGYRVYQYNSKTKKYEKIKTLKGTTYRVEKLKSGTAYKFKIKAYTKDGDTIWGKATDVITAATKPATPKITKLTTSKGKATFTWSDVSGESGYQVYCSTKKDSGFKKVASYKANVVKGLKSNLKSGKKYYFKVRAYKTVGETKVYSAWSAVKAVKIK